MHIYVCICLYIFEKMYAIYKYLYTLHMRLDVNMIKSVLFYKTLLIINNIRNTTRLHVYKQYIYIYSFNIRVFT